MCNFNSDSNALNTDDLVAVRDKHILTTTKEHESNDQEYSETR